MRGHYVHPFPARMAPQVALDALGDVRPEGRVLDPMCGSGTVLQAAVTHGLQAVGRDIDPLAVLMSRVATTKPHPARVRQAADRCAERAYALARIGNFFLPAIDNDPEALAYVRYWYAPQQERQLRALARALPRGPGVASNIMRLALSRTIVTKERGASLARDVSHSRPHRSALTNAFDVLSAFSTSVERILDAITIPTEANVSVRHGDARNLRGVADSSISTVVTSPPYLNAIDYIRGHKLALIWLGASLGRLKQIRSTSIGTERAPDGTYASDRIDALLRSNASSEALPPRFRNMFRRFAGDMDRVCAEVVRVLEDNGPATFVIGNSAIRGVPVDNAAVVVEAAQAHGLLLTHRDERELPPGSRYLPPPNKADSPLSRRMRTEVVLTFQKPAA